MDVGGVELGFFDVIWIFFILAFMIPLFRRKLLEVSRASLIRKIERKRESRLITLIHRQEGMSLLGIPVANYINIEDSEQIMRAIRFTPDDQPIDVVLHTPGGIVLAATQIALALKKHKGEVRVIVPHYAMSGGTLIALAADRIVMDENAVLGPIDPQLSMFMKTYPAASLLSVSKMKDVNEMDDETLIYADVARKALDQTRKLVCSLLKGRIKDVKEIEKLCDELTSGKWTHDHPLTFSDLQGMGIAVEEGVDREIYDLMDLYPQPTRITPSVEYIPVPYKKEGKRV